MKISLTALGATAILATSILAWTPAMARNAAVETTLRSYGDLSSFYQALINTGIINELREDQSYTIFAPTNVAFAQIRPQSYPCFYAVQCRAQVAALLRNHIVVGYYQPRELTTFGFGIQTANDGNRVYFTEPYVGQFAVNGRNVLSVGDTGGSIVYRIDGVIANPQDLATFQTVHYAPAPAFPAGTVIQKTTTYTTTPVVGAPEVIVPGGDQTTTVVHTYEEQY